MRSIYLHYIMFGKGTKSKQGVFRGIKNIFQTHPMAANMLTYGVMYTFAEATQQMLVNRKSHHKKKIDWGTIGRYGIVSVGILGPTLFHWYRFLDKIIPSVTKTQLFTKVIVDQAVAATGSTVVFFTGMSILEGKKDIFAELRAKFIPTYTMSCCFWLPAQAINFALLPPYTRVAFVGMASFIWVNVLCLVKRQEVPEGGAKSSLELSLPKPTVATAATDAK